MSFNIQHFDVSTKPLKVFVEIVNALYFGAKLALQKSFLLFTPKLTHHAVRSMIL